MDRIEHALQRAARTGKPMAVYFVDLDRFKLINDAGGHRRGDAVLTAVEQQRLGSRARGADTVARFSGDEFVILCENLTSDLGPRFTQDRRRDPRDVRFALSH